MKRNGINIVARVDYASHFKENVYITSIILSQGACSLRLFIVSCRGKNVIWNITESSGQKVLMSALSPSK